MYLKKLISAEGASNLLYWIFKTTTIMHIYVMSSITEMWLKRFEAIL